MISQLYNPPFFTHTQSKNVETTAYRIAGVGPFDLAKPFEIIVEHVHLLHQARESRFCRLSNLLVHSFGLRIESHNTVHAWEKKKEINTPVK